MDIGYVKGYDIFTVSKKKAEKIVISEELSEAVNAEELRAQMLDALENGGRVYALKKKKKLYACYIFCKTLKNADDFMEKDKTEQLKSKELNVYELVYEYSSPELDDIAENIKNDILVNLKEQASLYDFSAIIWKDDYYISEKDEGGKNYAGFLLGISLGIIYGLLFDSWVLGICLGIAFSQMFGWTMYNASCKNNATKEEKGDD